MRRIEGLETAKIVLCPEANLASEAKRIVIDLAGTGIENVYCLREDTNKNEGIRTTNKLKAGMYDAFNRLLNAKRVRWHERMTCVGNIADDEADERYDAEGMRKMVADQLAAYQRIVEPSTHDRDAPPVVKFSGKMAGDDDHALAIQLCAIIIDIWLNNQAFYGDLKPIYTNPERGNTRF